MRTKENKSEQSTEHADKSSLLLHCSNLQVWAEQDYDTRFIHSNLAFPLLKKLTEVGELKAKKMFKDEIGKRYENGPDSILFLHNYK